MILKKYDSENIKTINKILCRLYERTLIILETFWKTIKKSDIFHRKIKLCELSYVNRQTNMIAQLR